MQDITNIVSSRTPSRNDIRTTPKYKVIHTPTFPYASPSRTKQVSEPSSLKFRKIKRSLFQDDEEERGNRINTNIKKTASALFNFEPKKITKISNIKTSIYDEQVKMRKDSNLKTVQQEYSLIANKQVNSNNNKKKEEKKINPEDLFLKKKEKENGNWISNYLLPIILMIFKKIIPIITYVFKIIFRFIISVFKFVFISSSPVVIDDNEKNIFKNNEQIKDGSSKEEDKKNKDEKKKDLIIEPHDLPLAHSVKQNRNKEIFIKNQQQHHINTPNWKNSLNTKNDITPFGDNFKHSFSLLKRRSSFGESSSINSSSFNRNQIRPTHKRSKSSTNLTSFNSFTSSYTPSPSPYISLSSSTSSSANFKRPPHKRSNSFNTSPYIFNKN
eukprot:TRINITY_DN11174_c0_g1_i3.p1 TRINITY_DN11174_c0_g1~~TRINITY_DN11174_c0_g1_i3.p1  ORF type:complete len:385 (+),score=102.97 TRINITY_DN11174_c0_g1_i3:124-1278(+)